MLRDVNHVVWALRNVGRTTASLMVRYIELGPFDAAIFLVPPTATGSVLVVEQFQLWDAVHSEIGLDHIHNDRGIDAQALLNGDELRWKGKVLFSNAVHNKKQISSIGLDLLYTAAQQNGLKLDWSKGFKVILEAQYWRHSFIRLVSDRDKFHDPISCDLFVDLKPVTVIVGNPSRPTEKLKQRRFSIETMSPIFTAHSAKTFSQSGIILTLEHIKRVKKRTNSRNLTVKWYCNQYKELFSTTPGSDEADVPRTHQVRTNSRDFYSALASHRDSATFYQDLVVHKQLLSKDAFARFKRDCDDATRNFPPEVRKWWGQWRQTKLPQEGEMIVIEDTPPPPSPQDQQEQMDLEQLIVIDDDSLEIEDQEDEPMIWQPAAEETTTIPEATSTAVHTSQAAFSTAAVSSVGVSKSLSLDAEARHLISTIPKCMFDPPTLPADCQWVCPVTGCFTLFDLKGKLPRKVLVQLTPQEIDLLTSRAFTSKSQKAQSIFFVIVDVHYDEHLSKLGIVADKDVSKTV